ncbi:MAG: hypothetical protein DCF25_20225 [Leptolyngbya foveolarum]|uniref:CRISPR type III-B/RAMP module-associated protein Cmr5 n=1 Tax=Leptolyngbya foveolarum TaxID=47253 RepID=A0A2W4TSU9_9CYAN|nr:MAG: hypothetical protein DCF25_20225 [Leptolyngbya foveolarum]
MKLDSRQFSKTAHAGLMALRNGANGAKDHDCQLQEVHWGKASRLVQGLAAYISTWGLHRLSGDAKRFLAGKGEDTKYKGKVYLEFLYQLESFSQQKFDPKQETDLINMPLPQYAALNRLAMQLAKEWAFWAPAVLGEDTE